MLADLAGLLSTGLRGYTAGRVQGEELKYKRSQQAKQDDFKNRQLALQQAKLNQDRELAEKQGQDQFNLARQKYGMALRQFLFENQDKAAEWDRNGFLAQILAESEAAINGDESFQPRFGKAWAKATGEGTEPGVQAASPTEQDQSQYQGRSTMIDLPAAQRYLAQNPLYRPGVEAGMMLRDDGSQLSPRNLENAPRLQALLNAQQIGMETLPPAPEETVNVAPRPAPAPTSVGVRTTRGYEASVDKDRALAEASRTRAEKVEEEIPLVRPLATSLIGIRGAQSNLATASAGKARAETAAIPRRVEETKRSNQAREAETRRANQAREAAKQRELDITAEKNAIQADLVRMRTVTEGARAMEMEARVNELASKLPEAQAIRLKAAAGKMWGFDPIGQTWVPNQAAIDEVQNILGGAATGQSQGAPATNGTSENRAFLRTQDKVQTSGRPGGVNSVRRGNFQAAFGTSRAGAKSSGNPAPGAPAPKVDPELFNDADVRKKVEQEMANPNGYKKYLQRLDPEDRKTVEAIRTDILKKRKKPAKPQPNMMSSPRR